MSLFDLEKYWARRAKDLADLQKAGWAPQDMTVQEYIDALDCILDLEIEDRTVH